MNMPNYDDLGESLVGHYAGFATRLIAFIIDSLTISATLLFLTWFVNSTLLVLQTRNIIAHFSRWIPHINSIIAFLTSPVMSGIYTFLIIISYNVFFWSIAGQTIGKAVMGIKIIPVIGGKMTFKRALTRYVGYYISGLPLGLGFLWILVNDRRSAWHDRIAGTCVVHVWDARPDEVFLVVATEQMIKQRIKSLKRLKPGSVDSADVSTS
ncbi:MAG: hypothetical protein B6D39_03405 [Anaerolineae bacterium UTCFX2]|jgi:uncharacterized RDD family membrane protein YckC|nr:MAG: hypothetical protein B6D39_03405 [Anaerolineae bacterium UTCFX2]